MGDIGAPDLRFELNTIWQPWSMCKVKDACTQFEENSQEKRYLRATGKKIKLGELRSGGIFNNTFLKLRMNKKIYNEGVYNTAGKRTRCKTFRPQILILISGVKILRRFRQ